MLHTPKGNDGDQLRTEQSGLNSEVENPAEDGRAKMDVIWSKLHDGAAIAIDLLTDLRKIRRSRSYATHGFTPEHCNTTAAMICDRIDQAVCGLLVARDSFDEEGSPLMAAIHPALAFLIDRLSPVIPNITEVVLYVTLSKLLGASDEDLLNFFDESIATIFSSSAVREWPSEYKAKERAKCEALIRQYRQLLNDAKNVPTEVPTNPNENS